MRLTDKIADELQLEIKNAGVKNEGGKPILHFEVLLAPTEDKSQTYGPYMLVIGFFWPTAGPLDQSFYIRYLNPLEPTKRGVLGEAVKAALAVASIKR